MKITVGELRKAIREEAARAAKPIREGRSEHLSGLSDVDGANATATFEVDFGTQDGREFTVNVSNDVWTAQAEPDVGYGGDWEAQIANATEYLEDGTSRVLSGEELLNELPDEDIMKLEEKIEEAQANMYADY